MKKERSLAEKFCHAGNLFLGAYRVCGGQVLPRAMNSQPFRGEVASEGQCWYDKIAERMRPKSRTLFAQARILRSLLGMGPKAQKGTRIRGNIVVFADGSNARAVWIPGIHGKKIWYWASDFDR